MDLVTIEARDISDAWYQVIYGLIENGRVFKIDRGSYAGQKRLEYDYVTIRITHPGTRPLLPTIEPHYGVPNPVDEKHLYGGEGIERSYIESLMSSLKFENESYTYGERLTKYPLPNQFKDYKNRDDILIGEYLYNYKELRDLNIITAEATGNILDGPDMFTEYLNQIELLIWTYKNKGHRNNQMVLQVAHPTDMLLLDPPCLRTVDTRIQDGVLHFIVYFRSWDAWGGLPENLAAIQEMKEYIADAIGVKDGEIIASSKGLHVYDYCFDPVKVLRMKENVILKSF